MRKILPTVLLLFTLCSCLEDSGYGTMKLLLHNATVKTIGPEDSVTDVTKYSVTGNGPGGKTFTVDSSSASVTLTGMLLGQWRVEAFGYNSKGKTVISGSTDFYLKSESGPVTVNLDKLDGTGSIQLKYTWDAEISDPLIEFSIKKPQSSNWTTKKIVPGAGSDSSNYTVSSLASGCYIIRSVLYNNNIKVLGSTETVIVANGEKTTGAVSLTGETDYSNDLSDLYCAYLPGSPITGSFSGTSQKVPAGIEKTISLNLDSSYDDRDEYVICWYLDGSLLGEEEYLSTYGNSFSFIPDVGAHIINALVYSPETGYAGSATWKFIAEPYGEPGLAFYCNTLNSENCSVKLNANTLIAALPNDKYVAVTPDLGFIELCSVYNNNLISESKHLSSDNDWQWIEYSNSVFGSPEMNVFVVTDSKFNVNLLTYNLSKNTIQKVTMNDEVIRYEGGLVNPVIRFFDVTHAAFLPSSEGGGSVIICDADYFKSLNAVVNSSKLLENRPLYKPSEMYSTDCIDVNESFIAVSSESSGDVWYTKFDGQGQTSLWYKIETELSSVKKIQFLGKNNLIVTDGSKLCRFSYSSSKWNPNSSISVSVKDFAVADDDTFIYVLDTDNCIRTYYLEGSSIYYMNKTASPVKLKKIVLNRKSILGISGDGKIAVFKILGDE